MIQGEYVTIPGLVTVPWYVITLVYLEIGVLGVAVQVVCKIDIVLVIPIFTSSRCAAGTGRVMVVNRAPAAEWTAVPAVSRGHGWTGCAGIR